jgi:peptidoglycan-associated lipoprotein
VQVGGVDADGRFRDASTLAVTVPALSVGRYDIVVENPDGTRATLRKGLTLVASSGDDRCRPVTLRFGFDSSVLDAGMRAEIETAAACLRNSTEFVRVEGHCDDRGTTEYNLALGQRRADAVARYLVGLGVAPSRVQAVSYGEERPAAQGRGEAVWAENRRVEILPGSGR